MAIKWNKTPAVPEIPERPNSKVPYPTMIARDLTKYLYLESGKNSEFDNILSGSWINTFLRYCHSKPGNPKNPKPPADLQ